MGLMNAREIYREKNVYAPLYSSVLSYGTGVCFALMDKVKIFC